MNRKLCVCEISRNRNGFTDADDAQVYKALKTEVKIRTNSHISSWQCQHGGVENETGITRCRLGQSQIMHSIHKRCRAGLMVMGYLTVIFIKMAIVSEGAQKIAEESLEPRLDTSADRLEIELIIARNVIESVDFGKIYEFYCVTSTFKLDFRTIG